MFKTKLLRISKASELLGVTPLTLRRWDKSGRLKAIRMGSRGDRRYEQVKLLQLIKEGKI
jgi:excisionase family DNA binding protein